MEKAEWEAQQDELEKDRADNDETYEREEKEWYTYDYAPFKTEKVSFAVCLNTMGQDR